MENIQEKIDALSHRINEMASRHSDMGRQLLALIDEMEKLRRESTAVASGEPAPAPVFLQHPEPPVAPPAMNRPERPLSGRKLRPDFRDSLETFVGQNLASKLGILVTLIGIFIGSRYAIEHDLISPLFRIILGYLAGLILTGLALLLRKKYPAYSAVLIGGGLSVIYFITYVARGYYGLLGNLPSWMLLLSCTAAAVYAAWIYNRVIIAHLALVGAYAIPFLLSNNSGQYQLLLAYIALINTGMLILAFLKYWKSLQHAAFLLTWFIFLVWYFQVSGEGRQDKLALTYAGIYFLLFYISFLSYKFIRHEKYGLADLWSLLANAFIFFGMGYAILEDRSSGSLLLTLFALSNAAIHLLAGILLWERKEADRSMAFLLLGLGVLFITLTIPIRFDGNWVTLLWLGEAALLFGIAQRRRESPYALMAFVLLFLGLASYGQDFMGQLDNISRGYLSLPFLNIGFFTALVALAVMGAFLRWQQAYRLVYPPSFDFLAAFFLRQLIPLAWMGCLYGALWIEWQSWLARALPQGSPGTHEWMLFDFNFQLLYSMIFIILAGPAVDRFFPHKTIDLLLRAGRWLLMLILLLAGLSSLHKLGLMYLGRGGGSQLFGVADWLLRYPIMAAAFWAAGALRPFRLSGSAGTNLPLAALVRGILGWAFLSAEYLLWASVWGDDRQYRLGLSIVWALFAVGLIVAGIRRKEKWQRLMGIGLLLITLLKLFLFDISLSSALSKTISFISVGALLLLVSYLYNRYRNVLGGEEKTGEE